MAPSTPYQLECSARERLERQLHEERQRIKDACIQVTHIDPDTKKSRYEALVSVMMDALDQRVIRDNAAQVSLTPSQESDLFDVFDGVALERGALDALVAHLRNLNLANEQSTDRQRVLSNDINSTLSRESLDSQAGSNLGSIDWEDQAESMEVSREQRYREIEEHRARPRQQRKTNGGSAAKASSPSSDSH